MRVPMVRVEEIPDNGTMTLELLGHEVLLFRSGRKTEAYINICTRRGKDDGSMQDRPFEWITDTERDDSLCPGPQLIPLHTQVVDGVLTYVSGD